MTLDTMLNRLEAECTEQKIPEGVSALSERHRLHTESEPTAWVQVFAAYADSPFISSAGTRIYGMPGRTRGPHGIVLALWPGNSGTHRIARRQSCVASKLGGVGYQADVYGKPLRLTTVFRYFECGANTAI